jgi:hypothetical protein
MPAIHRKLLVWLLLTCSTSPSKTTMQIAIDGSLAHPHLFTLSQVRKTLGLQHFSKCAVWRYSNSRIPNQKIPRCLTKYNAMARQGGRDAGRAMLARLVGSLTQVINTNQHDPLLHQLLLSISCTDARVGKDASVSHGG